MALSIFCAHLIIFLGVMNLDIIMSSPPFESLHCLFVCNSNRFHSFIFKLCKMIVHTSKMCTNDAGPEQSLVLFLKFFGFWGTRTPLVTVYIFPTNMHIWIDTGEKYGKYFFAVLDLISAAAEGGGMLHWRCTSVLLVSLSFHPKLLRVGGG